jgi:Protein of unknown function (DUF3024)
MGASEVRSEKLAGWQKRPPELDIARVRRWCDQRVPDHALDEVRMECEIGPRHLTTVELCPPWRAGLGSEWTRSPIARLRYARTARSRTLNWLDRHWRFHLYDRLAPSRRAADLLMKIERGTTSIF